MGYRGKVPPPEIASAMYDCIEGESSRLKGGPR